jgi:hypothetical protein
MGRRGTLTFMSLLAVALMFAYVQQQQPKTPDVAVTTTSALQALKAENTLIVFSASIIVMATGQTSPNALINQKLVLVQPVLVHYGVNLSTLQPQQMTYDAATQRLLISLPDVTVVARDIDPARQEEVSNSGMIGKLSGTEDTLRKAAEAKLTPEIMRQASNETILQLARDSARRQVRHIISAALRSTGAPIEVIVQVGPQTAS